MLLDKISLPTNLCTRTPTFLICWYLVAHKNACFMWEPSQKTCDNKSEVFIYCLTVSSELVGDVPSICTGFRTFIELPAIVDHYRYVTELRRLLTRFNMEYFTSIIY